MLVCLYQKGMAGGCSSCTLNLFFAKVELQETNLPEPASNYCTKIRELNKADRATFDKVKNKPTRPKDVNHTYLVKINII